MARVGCVFDAECAAGQVCEAGRCGALAGVCAEVDDCPAGNACIDGGCVAPVACRFDFFCRQIAAGFECVDGACRAEVVVCARNAECDGQSCAFGACVPLASPECVRDAQCDGGEVCAGEVCGAP